MDMGAMSDMHGMPPGTFAGHVIPGSMLLFWGLVWLGGLWVRPGPRAAFDPLESSAVIIGLKLLLPAIGVAIEWPGSGWSRVSTVMNFQHVAMYAGFGLSGAVDLLQRFGRMSRGATYLAFAGAALNAGGLFL